MTTSIFRLGLLTSAAISTLLAGCGGDGGTDSAANPPSGGAAAPSATNVKVTVVDGPLQKATVCLDRNGNGLCDSDETTGTTDANGTVTLAVPTADVGKYPVLAIVDTTAVDKVNGPVTTRYTLTAPADQTAVVSPLTTLVQTTVATTGATSADAAKVVQATTGITASLFQDFTTAAAPTDGSVDPKVFARLVVLTTQAQAQIVAPALGTAAADGATTPTPITQADLDRATQKKLLELLPNLVSAAADPAVAEAAKTSAAALDSALAAQASTVSAQAGLTAAAVPVVVAINTQNAKPTTVVAATPAAALTLDTLAYTDASNYTVRTLGASAAQNTPDSQNLVRYVERRHRAAAGNVAAWGAGSDPARNSDLSWNGAAWVSCPINTENTSTVRDAAGNSTYTYCSRETGRSSRASFDIAGQTMADVYAKVRAAGYTNLFIASPASALGTAKFPADAKLLYQTNTVLTTAFSYYPAGAQSPAGTSNLVNQLSAAVTAGGIASSQAAGTACNSAEAISGTGVNSTTLEGMIASRSGTPCVLAPDSVTYNSTAYPSDADNSWWGSTTISLGTIGTVSTTPTSTSKGYYTGNTLLRIAFTGSGTSPVTYYACKQRFVNGSTRACSVIGTGSYTVATLGDGRALSLNNLPPAATSLNYDRIFVERGGLVYYGYKNRPSVTSKARLDTVAGNALLTQLGLPVDDPATKLALTAASYQGTYDFQDNGSSVSAASGSTVFFNASGSSSCVSKQTSQPYACTVKVTDPATGAFSYSDATGTAAGTFDFMAGTGRGTYHDSTSVPVDGTFVAGRR